MTAEAMTPVDFLLSPQQRRVWTLGGGEVGPYRAFLVAELAGLSEAALLWQALAAAVAEHEILRTVYRRLPAGGLPVQTVRAVNADGSGVVRLSPLAASAGNAQEALIASAHAAGFSVESGPLLGACLLPGQADRLLLLLVLPSLAADAVSLRLLARELLLRCAGAWQRAADDTASLQYIDIAEWQNGLMEEGAAAAYWQLQTAPRDMGLLPGEKPGSEGVAFAPASLAGDLGAERTERLRALSARLAVPLPVLLEACWRILLHRLSGGSVEVVAHACDGRTYAGLESALGPLERMLPVTCLLDGREDLRGFLDRLVAAINDAEGRQEYFVCEGEVWPVPYLSYGFSYYPDLEPAAVDGMSWRLLAQYSCSERFRLKAVLAERGPSIACELHYDPETFSRRAVAALVAGFEWLLESVLSQPQALIGEHSILPEAERHRLLLEQNDSRYQPVAAAACWSDLFERQAAATPSRAAVVCDGFHLTFGELDRQAGRLARELAARGVGPEVPVPIVLDRSVDMLVAMLGVSKAGGAYVPLEPLQPAARLAAILDELAAPVVITHHDLLPALGGHAAGAICLDRENAAPEPAAATGPRRYSLPANLCSILYTSGSTGRPKGVAIEHRQVLHYLVGIAEALELEELTSFAMISSFTADLGNTMIFPSLALGGCLHVLPRRLLLDAEGLGEYFQRHPVDCLKIVPSHLDALLATARDGWILPRERLVLGGEVCRFDLIDRIRAHAPLCRIYNHYGPTETTVGVAVHLVVGDERQQGAASIPLGRALPGATLYVLDPLLAPVPTGVAGELYIGGGGVARGYLHGPDRTAELFIPNPFSDQPGSRLYRTGDRVRWLPIGELEFLGRTDGQLKVRGFRVELGEIEAVLHEHPAVWQAAVGVQPDGAGGSRLVAYVVAREGAAPDLGEVHRFLATQLPEHMLPAVIVPLRALPLGPNGKLDRQALPAAVRDNRVKAGADLPRSDIERQIAALWCEVLCLERVGINENFFDLGGHSLLLVQVHSRLQELFAKKFSILDLFRLPTIGDLSAFLGEEAEPRAFTAARRGARQREAMLRRQHEHRERRR